MIKIINGIGFFKIHRELFNKPIWAKSTLEQKIILITIIAKANFRPNEWEWKGEKFKVNPGQFITSLDKIAKDSGKGITTQNVRTALKRFEKMEFLTNESTKEGRLVTIVNWESYQVKEDNQQSNQQRPNKDLTNDQQRPNKELTPREERKKVKKVKKIKKDEYNNIFDYWNTKEIMIHKTLNQIMKNEIDKALKDYTIDEIKTAIDHYGEAYKSKYQYCNYKWGLDTFLKRAEGYTKFMDDGDKWIRYSDWIKNPNKSQEDSKPKTITRFHNFEQRTSKYTAKELDDIAKKIRKAHKE